MGAFGHSQGGWVVYEATATTDVIDFAISNSGPAVSPAVQERHALERATHGHDDQRGAMAMFDDLVQRARLGQQYGDVVEEVDLARGGSLRGYAAGLLDSRDEWDLVCLLMSYDPRSALGPIKVPLLAVYGARDPIVPVAASLDALRKCVADELLSIAVLEGGGHRLEPDDGEGFVDGYLDTITQFATACARRHRQP